MTTRSDKSRSTQVPELNPGDEAAPGTSGAGENTCPKCQGSGRLGAEPCPHCGGTGMVTEGVGGG